MSSSAESPSGTTTGALGYTPTGQPGSVAPGQSWADVPVRVGGRTVGIAVVTQTDGELVGLITLTNPAILSKLSISLGVSIGPFKVQHSLSEGL